MHFPPAKIVKNRVNFVNSHDDELYNLPFYSLCTFHSWFRLKYSVHPKQKSPPKPAKPDSPPKKRIAAHQKKSKFAQDIQPLPKSNQIHVYKEICIAYLYIHHKTHNCSRYIHYKSYIYKYTYHNKSESWPPRTQSTEFPWPNKGAVGPAGRSPKLQVSAATTFKVTDSVPVESPGTRVLPSDLLGCLKSDPFWGVKYG